MTIITYEQPISELVRVCLRLEHVFNKANHLLQFHPEKNCPELINLIIDIINLLDRPDLKSKLTQELHRTIATLSKLNHLPNISHEKLDETLKKLKALLEYFASVNGKIGQHLKENDFFTNIRLRQSVPSAECSFEIPAYFHWLQQPKASCVQSIKAWLSEFTETREAVNLLLYIIRHCAEPTCNIAESGFYFKPLNLQVPTQLIRVSFDEALNIYPEISAGKHRLNIRFFVANHPDRAYQTADNIPFKLTCCNI